MLKVEIIDHHMDINPQGLDVEDIKRIESMLTCMLRETIIESYLITLWPYIVRLLPMRGGLSKTKSTKWQSTLLKESLRVKPEDLE